MSINVVEAQALHFVREKFFGEAGFACAVAAGDEINCWFEGGHQILRLTQPLLQRNASKERGGYSSRLRVNL